jgi:hypothetical protein
MKKHWLRNLAIFIGSYCGFTLLNLFQSASSTTVQNSIGDMTTLTQSTIEMQLYAGALSILLTFIFVWCLDANEKDKPE